MIEIPEAIVLAKQLEVSIKDKIVDEVVTLASPHKFAFFHEDPKDYESLLKGKKVIKSYPLAGRVEIDFDDILLSFNDGVNLRFYQNSNIPEKHQLLIRFDDSSTLVASVAMYGGLVAYKKGEMDDNFYYRVSKEAVSPLSDDFTYDFFMGLFDDSSYKMSAKAFLATKQRIPGLGNGILQDILLNARVHPKRKMNTLSESELHNLFDSIKSTIDEMVSFGGRDTEKDLYGNAGSYITKLSKKSILSGCVNCGGKIIKESYMGGSIYYCSSCQQLQ